MPRLSKSLALTVAAASILLSAAARSAAQVPRDVPSTGLGVLSSIVGTVFDSLARRPLIGAHVHLADLGRDAVSDSLGMFRFDSVSPGVHTVWVDHPILDRLGLYSIRTTVDATPQAVASATLAIPSFATLWHRACQGEPPRSDNGFLYGQVSAGSAATRMTGTAVELVWHGNAADSSSGPSGEVQRRMPTNAAGSYAICDVPTQQTVTLAASGLGATTSAVSFQIGESRIARRDLTLQTPDAMEQAVTDSSTVTTVPGSEGATVAGVLRDSAGRPLRDSRVTVSGMSGEWRSNANGAFVVHGIPQGTHVIATSAFGFLPERRLVDLTPHDSAFLELSVTRLITRLNTVTVREREKVNLLKKDLASRCSAGFGYCADSTALDRLPTLWAAFNFPGVQAKRNPLSFPPWTIIMSRSFSISVGSSSASTCSPTLWIDGAVSDIEILNAMSKDEIGLIEVYNSAAGAPSQYAGTRTNCGIVLIWRKVFISP